MATLTEGVRNGEFVLMEGNGTYSRTQVTIAESQGDMVSGTLVGKVSADGTYAKYDNAATDGSQTCAGILYNGLKNSTSPQAAVIINRQAEVMQSLLVGFDPAAETDLLALGIVPRNGPPALITGVA